MNTIIGVYSITCLVNGKRYIGESVHIKRRWSVHKHYLNKNNHKRKELQKDWNLFGKSNFLFEILEECNLNSLKERGQYYMDLYQCTNTSTGYNLEPLSISSLGSKRTTLSLSHKRKLKESLKEKWKENPEIFLKNRSNPSLEQREKISLIHKNLWKSEQYRLRQKISRSITASTIEGRLRIKKANEAAVKSRSKTFLVESPNKEIWLVTNLAKFCREFNLKRSSLGDVIKGRAPSCYGWKAQEATIEQISSFVGNKYS